MACIGVSSVSDTEIIYNNSANVIPPAPLTSFNLRLERGINLVNIIPSTGLVRILPAIGFIIDQRDVRVNENETIDGRITGYAEPVKVNTFLVGPSLNSIPFTLSYAGTIWFLLLTVEGKVVADTSTICTVTSRGVALPGPPIPGAKQTTIIIRSENMSQVDYRVINPAGLCQTCCAVTEQTKDYRFYCVNFRSVLICPNQPISSDLEQYALARLILSLLIFGSFNVNYLRQRYYEDFISRIQKCYPNFTTFFNTTYFRYRLLFKK